jgi:hypothetical protein
MALWSTNEDAARFRVFRIALSFLGVVATLSVIGTWLDHDHALSLNPMEPGISPIWIVGLVGLCSLQVVLLWWNRITLSWWEPIIIESVLCMAFAICRHQVVGTFLIACSGGQDCTTIRHPIVQGSWLGGFAAVGVVLGVLWSLVSRWSRLETASSQ